MLRSIILLCPTILTQCLAFPRNGGIRCLILVYFQVLNVQVPFLFKHAVDWLTTATGNAGALASFTSANPTLFLVFATPASVLIGYGIARTLASAFNGTTNEVIAYRRLFTFYTFHVR